MRSERFFRDDLLPFAEVRYSKCSTAPFKPHMHQTLSIGAVDQGEVYYNVSDKPPAILAPGSLATINPETLHSCNPKADTVRSYYMLYLDVEWCLGVQQSMWGIDSFLEMQKTRVDDEVLYNQYCQTMEHVMDAKKHLQEKEQMLFDLVAHVFSVSCELRPIRKMQLRSTEKMKLLLSKDLQKDLPITTLAMEFNANPYTLIRNFKAVTGLTPHAYRMNYRIEQAKEHLRRGCDIAETALLCGFFDQSHFHRHFKAMTTVTPRQYLVNFIQ